MLWYSKRQQNKLASGQKWSKDREIGDNKTFRVTSCLHFAQVRHLEENAAALAEDLIQKSAIIQAYAMETKIGEYCRNWPITADVSAMHESEPWYVDAI